MESNSSQTIFSPKRSGDIKPLQMEVVNRGYIPLISGGYCLIAGEGGVGKSLVAIKSMVVYLMDNPMKQSLMVMTEDGILECTGRLKMICDEMGADYSEIDARTFWMTAEEIDIPKLATKGAGGVNEKKHPAIEALTTFCFNENVGFITLDPLRAFHDLEENSNDAMPLLTKEILPTIGKQTGAVVLVLHHSAKGAEGSGVRGAGSIGNDARVAWTISRAVEKDKVTGRYTHNEKYDGMIQLNIYKDNFNIQKYCKIRGEHNMISLPGQDKKIEPPMEIVYEMPDPDPAPQMDTPW